jgi:uncharacterized membrane protein YsdA (DUF1294 family)
VPTPLHSPQRFHGVLALIFCGLAASGLWWLFGCNNSLPIWLGCWLAAVNGVTFGYYAYDKARASRGGRRVPEIVLHGLSVAGGSPAAFLAMRLFRHKTIKSKFRIFYWCIVVLQAALFVWIVTKLG